MSDYTAETIETSPTPSGTKPIKQFGSGRYVVPRQQAIRVKPSGSEPNELNRRQFLKGLGAVVTAALFAGSYADFLENNQPSPRVNPTDTGQINSENNAQSKTDKSLVPEIKDPEIAQWEELVLSIVANLDSSVDPQNRSKIAKTLLALMPVESSGNPEKESIITYGETSKGLLQIKDSTAAEIASRHQIAEYDLFSPKDNILIGAYEVNRFYYEFSDYGTVAAAHNLGEGRVLNALQAYLILEKHIPREKVENDFNVMGKQGEGDPASTFYINQYHITWQDILDSPAVTGALKSTGITDKDLDGTKKYLESARVMFPGGI